MTDYYCDYENGSDGGAGTFADPWQYPVRARESSNFSTEPVAGDNIYLARGSEFLLEREMYFDQTSAGTAGSPVRFMPYTRSGGSSADADPIISFYTRIADTDWTHSTGQVWSIDLGTHTGEAVTNVSRVFFNEIGQNGEAASSSVTANNPWYFDGATDTLYVYSPSTGTTVGTDDPTTQYGSVWCTTESAQRSYGLQIYNCSYFEFHNITFRGSGTTLLALRQTGAGVYNTDNLTVKNCAFEKFGTNGIEIWVGASPLNPSNGGYIGYNTIDRQWNSLEVQSGGYDTGDGVNLSEGVEDTIVEWNTFIDCCHSAVGVENATAGRLPNNRNTIRHNDISVPTNNEGRGVDISGVANLTLNTNCHSNYIHNTKTQNQIQGQNTWFTGNIIDTVRDGATADTQDGISTVCRTVAEVVNVNILNNVVINTANEGIHVSDNGLAINGYNCKNNIVVKKAGDTDVMCLVYGETLSNTGVSIENNDFYSEDNTGIINWDGTTYTVSGANSAVTEMDGNKNVDPDLSNYVPSVDDSDFYAAGKHVSFSAKDYQGRWFGTPPDIGAHNLRSRGMPARTGRYRR